MTYTIKGEARSIPMTPGEAALLDGAIAYLSERVEVPTGCVVEWGVGGVRSIRFKGVWLDPHEQLTDVVRWAIESVESQWKGASAYLALLLELRRCADIAPVQS